ncbi:hypothetical protein [Candidatus Thalassolituus haligoni]|tara:strand:+ start:3981 stop:4130 length:150 start_codon:yes stop_codon:yes gene_type:complete
MAIASVWLVLAEHPGGDGDPGFGTKTLFEPFVQGDKSPTGTTGGFELWL